MHSFLIHIIHINAEYLGVKNNYSIIIKRNYIATILDWASWCQVVKNLLTVGLILSLEVPGEAHSIILLLGNPMDKENW